MNIPLDPNNGESFTTGGGFARLSDGAKGAGDALKPAIISPIQGTRATRRKPIERKLNFGDLIKMLYRGRWIILITFLAVFAFSVYSAYNKAFIYASSTRMLIEKPPVGMMHSTGADDDHAISNQIQFFKSHVVGQHVARLLHEFASGDRHEVDSLFLEGFHSTATVPKDPRTIRIIKMDDNPSAPQKAGIPSESILEERATKATTIQPDGANDYLMVATEGYTPEDASFLANLYVVVFATDNLARSRANSSALKEFLMTQKQKSYDTLHVIENQLRDYLSSTNGLSADQEASAITQQYQDAKIKLENLKIDQSTRERNYDILTQNLDTVQKNLLNNLTLEPYIAMLQGEIAKAEFEVEQSEMDNSAMDPRAKKYIKDEQAAKKDRIAGLREELKEREQILLHSQIVVPTEPTKEGQLSSSTMAKGSTLDGVTTLRQSILGNKMQIALDSIRIRQTSELLDKLQQEGQTIPERMMKSAQLRRAQGVAEKLYDQLEDKYMSAWLTEESVFGNVRVEDPAAINPIPIRPNRQSSIFTGALAGLGIGIALVIALSFLDSTIRSPEEIESHNVSLLATIPIIGADSYSLSEVKSASNERPKFTPHRVSHLDPRSSVAESYRSLRTAIQFAGLDREIRSIAISSSAPQEGKSTTSSNLGIVMAQMGKRTILLDTDLRRPVLHSVFGIPREPGLTNVLFNRASLDEAIHPTDVPNLFVLPCGIIPPNPAELLASVRMQQLIAHLKEQYDIVILDTPPVVAVTDALVLSRQVDAIVLIARSDTTRVDALFRAIDSIEKTGAPFIGVVLNNFNVANAYGSYYKYYQYYHYYSSAQQGGRKKLSRFLPKRHEKDPVA